MMKRNRIAMVGMFLVLVFTSVALAEEKAADNMQILREKLQGDKKFLVAENMNLSEKEAEAFWPVYTNYQKDLVKLNDRSIKLINDYASNFSKMSDDVAKKLLEDSLSIEGDRQNLRESYVPKFAKVLPYSKIMRYYQLENKISAAISYDIAGKIPLVK